MEVNGRTVGTFRIVRYIMDVRCWEVFVKQGSTVVHMNITPVKHTCSSLGWPHSFVPVVSVSLDCEWALPPSVESPWSAQASATSGGSACAVSLYRTCQQHWQWFIHVCLLSFFWKEWISWAQTTSTVWKLAASSTWRILSHYCYMTYTLSTHLIGWNNIIGLDNSLYFVGH